jgi:hypothetical protein
VAAKYLPHFPKPVLDDLVTGKWLPVIGAGMSLNAVVPAGKKMPLWGAMGQELTDELSDFASTSILDGISAYQHEFGRARLIERLSEILFIKGLSRASHTKNSVRFRLISSVRRIPLLATYLSNQLITKTAVFIGYSLDDPDFKSCCNGDRGQFIVDIGRISNGSLTDKRVRHGFRAEQASPAHRSCNGQRPVTAVRSGLSHSQASEHHYR